MALDLVVLLEHDATVVDKLLGVMAELGRDGVEPGLDVPRVGEDPTQDAELFLYVVGFGQEIKLPSRVQSRLRLRAIRFGPGLSQLLTQLGCLAPLIILQLSVPTALICHKVTVLFFFYPKILTALVMERSKKSKNWNCSGVWLGSKTAVQ